MKTVSQLAVTTGIASVSLFTLVGSAQAFSFTTNFEGSSAQGDILLKSVVLDTNEVVSQFSYIQSANIVANDPFTGGNTGAASADKGDNATTGVNEEDASEADIALNLSTNNLNNIIDTEDEGSFQIDLFFEKTIDNLLIWERGMNSKLGVQALDAAGNLIGNKLVLDSQNWNYAGFDIDTLEIGSAQKVGSLGVNIASDLGVTGPVSSLRFFSESGFNGPDWKFVGTDATRSEDVPEPGLVLGLGLVGGAALLKRLRTV